MLLPQIACIFLLVVKFVLIEGNLVEINEITDFSNYIVILDAFITTQPHVNIISSVEQSEKYLINGIVESLFKNESTASYTLNAFDARNKVNLIIIDSLNSFRRITDLLYIHNGNVFVIVSIKEINVQDIQNIFQEFWDRSFLEVFVVYESQGTKLMATFNPFSSISCNNLTPLLTDITVTSNKLQVNSKQFRFNGRTLINFNKCPIRFGLFPVAPYILNTSESKNLNDFSGRDIFLMKVLSKALNFTTKFDNFEAQYLKEMFLSLINNSSDVLIGDFYLRHDRWLVADVSNPYFSTELVLVIPHGRPYTSFESLIMSFELTLWIFVAIVLFVALFTILLLKIRSKREQKFVFGSNVKHPIFNLVIVLLGVPQTKLPGRNFARFLLMNFVLFSFVIRSVYQGAAYKFLQTNIHHKEVQSIEGITEQDFSIYVFDELLKMLTHVKFEESKIRSISSKEFDKVMENLKNPHFKGVLVRTKSVTKYISKIEKFDYKTCKQPLLNIPIVLYFKKDSVLTDTFNKKLGQLKSSGLIEYWSNMYFRSIENRTNVGPKTLTMNHLIGIFQVFIVGCSFASFILVLEKVKAIFSPYFYA